MNPALRSSAAHVFVGSLAQPVLDDDDAHHLRVLRISESDRVSLCDGNGAWAVAHLHRGGELVLIEVGESAPLPPRRRVLSAIPKGDRPEWMVQKLTEVGCTSIGFVVCERSVVHWEGDRLARQMERLRRVARQAAMQSRCLWVPTVEAPVDVSTIVDSGGVAVADLDGGPLEEGVHTIVVGPEGGWNHTERGYSATVCLSSQVLRVETAAMAAGIALANKSHGAL